MHWVNKILCNILRHVSYIEIIRVSKKKTGFHLIHVYYLFLASFIVKIKNKLLSRELTLKVTKYDLYEVSFQ